MKIKTITCHDVYNVGASLQAYALVTYLRKLGHDAQIIDYKPDYLSNHYPLWGLGNPAYDKPVIRELYNLAKLPGRLKARNGKRKAEYDRFTAEFLPLTPRRYTSNDDLKQNPPEADVYFAGSDQIWNCFFPNGKDPAFYLDFAPAGSVRASYAASFAMDDIPEEWKPDVKRRLSGLDHISVRESSGAAIVERLGIPGAVQVMDPVFLLDSEAWASIEKPVPNTEPYVLLYDFDRNPEMVRFARRMAEENGWKLYSVLSCGECDRCFEQDGPLTFLNLVHHAQFVVSNSFHATAFSLIFRKQFVVFNRQEHINTRMRDLLTLVGTESQLMENAEQRVETVDYCLVSRKLDSAVAQSKAFITTVAGEQT